MKSKTPLETALYHSKFLGGFAVWSCFITTIGAATETLGLHRASFLDAILLALSAYFIFAKQSRMWALLVASDFIGSRFIIAARGQSPDWLWLTVYTYIVGLGLYGVFRYHHIKKNSEVPCSS